jgi:hypothetical protein
MPPKSLAAGDTFPPNRAFITGDFYRTKFDLEYLSQLNWVQEDRDPGPGEDWVSTLDTLYRASGPLLVQPQDNFHNVVMSSYHGSGSALLVFTGFDLWSYQRSRSKSLVDFVLHQMWGLNTRSSPVVARPPFAPLPLRPRPGGL